MRENTPPPALDNLRDIEANLEDEELEEVEDFGEGQGMDDPVVDSEEEFEEAVLDGAGNLQFANNVPDVDVSVLSFTQHQGPVFCCHLHPKKDLAVTGGEDDTCYIWNTITGEVVFKIERSDSVTHAAFNHDGVYVAIGDISGVIEVFKIDKGKFTKTWDYAMGDMSWMKWHTSSNVLMAGSDAGEVYVWRIPSGDCKILPSHGSKCETGQLSRDGKKLLTGYADGSVKLWDIRTTATIIEVPSSEDALTLSVVSVASSHDYDLYMAGSEDCKILFMNSNGPLQVIDTDTPIECVSFCQSPDLKVCATCSLNGQIMIWDYIRYTLRVSCDYEKDDGVSILQWLPNQTLLAGTLMGHLVLYDGRSGSKICALSGHSAGIYDVCYDEREQIVLTASEDHTAKIFKYAP